jgi:DNA-binding CsgD family transcriptional regulator
MDAISTQDIDSIDSPDRSTLGTATARQLLACAIAGGRISEEGIHRFAEVSLVEARQAWDACKDAGLVNDSDSVEQIAAIALIDELPPQQLASIRAKAARAWMTEGPQHFLDEVQRAKSLGGLLPLDEIVELSDRAGHMSLSLHDYTSAVSLFQLAIEFDLSGELDIMAERMCSLASALDGLGKVSEARDFLARAAALAEHSGNGARVAAAAIQHALPVDWYAGDSKAIALLARATSMDLCPADEVRVLAARSLVEMRIPVAPVDDQQVAWVTRPRVSHELADSALEKSASESIDVRALAHLAWRTTHRAPRDLDRRREISRESLNLAQELRSPTYQVESSVWLAVDAVESSDRPLYDEALSVARWVAERDGNPRLMWRAHTLSCGAAHMDGNLDEAEKWRLRARDVGQAVSSPGWLAADLLLLGQTVVSSRDLDLTVKNFLPEDSPALVNPIGRAVAAVLHAEVGDLAAAERMIRKSLRQLDPESSYLLLATRCADVTLRIGNPSIAEEIHSILEPWQGHYAVDSNGWWIDGPVDLWLALLLDVMGRTDESFRLLDAAELVAKGMDDTRSLRRITESRLKLEKSTTTTPKLAPPNGLLTPRQQTIVELISEGFTNREIADQLSFSVSTIRAETVAIYRILEVDGRAEAVAKLSRLSSTTTAST